MRYWIITMRSSPNSRPITKSRRLKSFSGKKVTRSGGGEVAISNVELLVDEKPVRAIRSGSKAVVQVSVQCHLAVDELTVGILIRDRLGNDVFGTNSFHHGVSRHSIQVEDMEVIEFEFPSLHLGRGSYTLTVALHSRDTHLTANYDWWDRAMVFQVVPDDSSLSIGVCNMPVEVRWREGNSL